MRKLRILQTNNHRGGWGGQPNRILMKSEGLIDRGHFVIIAAPRNSTLVQRAKAKGYAGYESDEEISESGLKQKTEQGRVTLELKGEKQGEKSEPARTDVSDKTKEELKRKKLELENEYNAIEKEREELERLKSELKTNQQKLQYNSACYTL